MIQHLDLAQACEREPIEVPGSIQPFGALICVHVSRRRIFAVSENLSLFVQVASIDALDACLDQVLRQSDGTSLYAALERLPEGQSSWLQVVDSAQGPLECHARSHAGIWLLELERAYKAPNARQDDLASHNALSMMDRAQTLQDLAYIVAQQVQLLSGFERVMVYRFDDTWNGEVFAEHLGAPVDSYLGQRFPASDIPAQARRMLVSNRLRIIPDVDYRAERLLTSKRFGRSATDIDLGISLLRSVSPIHLEYLRNMRVGATLTISLLHGERLWGLVACHHRAPHLLLHRLRASCELLGRFMSSLIAVKEQLEQLGVRMRMQRANESLASQMGQAPDIVSGLVKHDTNLLTLAEPGCASAAVYFDAHWTLIGKVPTLRQLHALVDWLLQHAPEELFVTDRLPRVFAEARAYSAIASGLIAAPLPKHERNYLLLFRPEEIQTIDWAGRPEKSIVSTADSTTLHPRQSFARWEETVHERSAPWRLVQIEAVKRLRRDLVEVDLEKQSQRERDALKKMATERHRFAFLAELSAILGTGLDYEASLQKFAAAATQTFCDWCVVYTQRGGRMVRLVVDHATAQGREVARSLNNFAPPCEVPQSPLQKVFADHQPVLLPRVSLQMCRRLGGSEAYGTFVAKQLGLASVVAVPVLARGALLGAVKFARSRCMPPFDEQDMRLACELARRVAHAVDNAMLYNRSQAAIAAREHVLGVVSHDLKNPIGAVQLNASRVGQLLGSQQDAPLVVRMRKCLDRVDKSCRRMNGLIEDMLNLSKIEEGCFNVNKVAVRGSLILAEVEEMLEPLATSRQLRLTVRNQDPQCELQCEPERLMQVFSNLVGNAIKFTPSGGHICVELRKEAGQVIFAVIDNGPGIAAADLRHIFDRFWQSERAAKHGAGLGLAIAKGIVEAHGGKIWVCSEQGTGTTFNFTLDARQDVRRG